MYRVSKLDFRNFGFWTPFWRGPGGSRQLRDPQKGVLGLGPRTPKFDEFWGYFFMFWEGICRSSVFDLPSERGLGPRTSGP